VGKAEEAVGGRLIFFRVSFIEVEIGLKREPRIEPSCWWEERKWVSLLARERATIEAIPQRTAAAKFTDQSVQAGSFAVSIVRISQRFTPNVPALKRT
jgi:hypothetical protein